MQASTISFLLAALAAAPLSAALPGAPLYALRAPQPAAAAAQSGTGAIPVVPATVIPINALPFTITAPGYYRVTKSLNGVAGSQGIVVNALHVVIDLNGFRLTGVGGSLTGIFGASDCTVINGEISSWTTGIGLADNTRVINVEVSNCTGDGVGLATGLVEGCTIRNNGGNGVYSPNRATVSGCTIRSNGTGFQGGDLSVVQDSDFRLNFFGIRLGNRSQTLRCSVDENTGFGIVVGNSSEIADCTAFGNGTGGIQCESSGRIEGCRVEGSIQGITAGEGSLVADCTATGNTNNGIMVLQDATVQRCTVIGSAFGIALSGGGRIDGCTVRGSTQSAVDVAGNTWVSGNTILENPGRGIRASSTGNRIDGNHLVKNGFGIEVTGSRNLIVRNSLDTNTVQMQIAPDNVQGPLLKTKGFVQSTNPWANFDLSFP